MKTFLFAAVAALTAATALPAAAEPALRGGPNSGYGAESNGGYRDAGYREDGRNGGRGDGRHAYGGPDTFAPVFTRADLDRLQFRIDRNFDRGRLTRREARWLSAQVRDLRHLAGAYWRTGAGIGPRERRDLEFRYAELNRRIRWESTDRDYRY